MSYDEKRFIEFGKSFAGELEKKSPDQISVEYNFMGLTEHLTFIAEVFNTLQIELTGTGMEVAAGVGTFACSLARLYPAVERVYALDILPDVVRLLQPRIIEATNMQGKVIPMLGDFNDIKLPDNSLDFVVGFSSFHHSDDLPRTLKEVARVLKPGGRLIFFDRAAPDSMPQAQEEWLLNKEYTRDFKIQHGLDPEKPYTRGQNGEHEPRFRDFREGYAGAGLQEETMAIFSQRSFKRFMKTLIQYVPYRIRAWYGRFQYLAESRKFVLFYLCPPLAKHGKLQYFTLHTKFKTPAAAGLMKYLVLSASKPGPNRETRVA
jgi:demethylmenaquinone methyltransferase/2-methoxy-6-polyprenyl-1,4-benzoquinol methylase